MARRSPFRPDRQRETGYVVVRRIRLSSGGDFLSVGAAVPDDLKRSRLQSWYQRGLIGLKGDPWTDEMLNRRAARVARDAVAEPAPQAPATEAPADEPKVVPTTRRATRKKAARKKRSDQAEPDPFDSAS